MNNSIGVIDYGLGNIASIANMIKKIGGIAEIVTNPKEINKNTKLILPGVGSFDQGIKNLTTEKWVDSLNDIAQDKHLPILGICLGMQLMCKSSEEGKLPGLNWIDAEVKRFSFHKHEKHLKIPHMGWNTIEQKKMSPLFSSTGEKRFYFVHSYHTICNDEKDILATTHYGNEFTCAFSKDNIWGVQFHPEKSHRFGMELIKNFVEM